MKLEDVRQRLVQRELDAQLAKRRGELMPAIVITIIATILFLLTLQPPDEWAKGEWFQPGGFMRELLGYDGAVLSVRAMTALAALTGLFWLAKAFYSLTPTSRERQRAKIAAAQTRLKPPSTYA